MTAEAFCSGAAGDVAPAAQASTSAPSTSGADTPPQRTKICVFCGSSPGYDPAHMEAARELARVMAKNNIALVYGGGTVGLMGELAKTMVAEAGADSVHGIIPEALVEYERDRNYTSSATNGHRAMAVPSEAMYGKTTVVRDMHTRKRMMAREVKDAGPGSGFIALSGGYGTIEELFEMCTWNQLGIHDKGICVLNVDGFYDGILSWIGKSVANGFVNKNNANILVQALSAEDAVEKLRNYQVSPSVLKLVWGNE